MRFNEDCRVKIPATIHLVKLGYEYVSLLNQRIDQATNIFIDIFREQLSKINGREIGEAEFEEVLREIRKVVNFNDSGKEFYNWLINPDNRLKLIDFEDITNNKFNVANELTFGVDLNFRPDINILINGIPLAFLEVKKPNNDGGIQEEFNRMINYRLVKPEFKSYFNIIQIMGFSNNMPYIEIESVDNDDSVEKKQGSFYAAPNGVKTDFNYFREEEKDFSLFENVSEQKGKEILKDNKYSESEYDTPEFQTNLKEDRPVNIFSTSIFTKERLMFFLKYGIMYAGKQKHVMRYSQFFAVKNILNRIKLAQEVEAKEGKEAARPYKRGIVWHAQGSGKTSLSAFTSRVLQDYFNKQNKLTRNFFVVDRLYLAVQANDEFGLREFAVKTVDSKHAFSKELKRPITSAHKIGLGNEITVVNIQKIMEQDEPLNEIPNEYGAKVQRIIFIDEAHRSYSSSGSFLANLMMLDPDAIYIALTGTPILNVTEKTKLKFGDYYHKYFYDKSIADGYTLKIKIEPVATVFEDEIRRNIEIEENTLDILNSDRYIGLLAKYIDDDFQNFRYWSEDNTIGGMIVCKHKEQAKKIQKWFEEKSNLKTALVLDDTDDNKSKQNEFRKTDQDPSYIKYDILIVQYMLTTGYDVKRLKKMYLLRNPDKHTLLQTISRVNRPYTKPSQDSNDKKIRYPYGYVMDFAGIEDHFKTTMAAYTKELEQDTNESGEDQVSLKGVIIDAEEINKQLQIKYLKLKEMIDIDNKEEFSIQLMRNNKDNVLKIRKLLESIKASYTEFALSGRKDLMQKMDMELIKYLLREVQNRLNFLNLIERPVEQIKVDWISNEEVVNIIFQFIKKQSHILNLSMFTEKENETSEKIRKISEEIKRNKNIYSSKMVKLDQELKRVLKRLMMSDVKDLESVDQELAEIYRQLEEINRENEKLSNELGNDFGYVKTYQDYIEEYPDTDEETLKQFFKIVKSSIDKIIVANRQIYRKKNIFVATVKEDTTIDLLNASIFEKLDINDDYDRLLNRIYNNIDLYK